MKIGIKNSIKKVIHFLAFGFGSGFSPVAPGTMGTLLAALIYWPLSQLDLTSYLVFTAVVCITGIYICGVTARDLGVHDHGGIVWDEFAGFFLAMVPLQAAGSVDSYRFGLFLVLGFVLFRLFDVLKPWPISWLDQHIRGGVGIMLDDLLAGLWTLCIIQALMAVGL